MSKARTLANLISDNAELADGQISVAEVVGAAPTANPTFTGVVGATTISSPTLNATINLKTTDANGEGIGLGIDADKKVRFYDDQGASTKMYWNASTVTQKFEDNSKIAFGSSEDLQIYHDGGNSYIKDNGSGALSLQSNGTAIVLEQTDGENMILANINSDVKLYYDGSEKLATTSTGINVTGTATFSSSVSTPTLASPDGTTIITLPNTGIASFPRGAVFNDSSIDSDFRVESNNNTHMLFVDAGNDRISVGSGNTYSMFNVISSNDNTSDWWTNSVATQYIQNTVGHPVLKMNNNNTNRSAYVVYNGNGSAQGFHIFDRQNEQSRISAYTSSVVINEAGTDVDFRVESTNNTHMLFVDATNQNVNVRGAVTADPANSMNISGNIRLGADGTTRGDTIRSAGGASSSYNGMVLMSNHINSSDQANSSLSSWLVDIGGSWADGTNFPPSTSDSFTVARRAAGGSKYGSAKYLGIKSNATVINEDSNNHDFRVESGSDTHMLFVDASNNTLSVGTSSPPPSHTVNNPTMSIARAARIGEFVHGSVQNIYNSGNGRVFTVNSGNNGQAAMLQITAANHNGVIEQCFYLRNDAGTWVSVPGPVATSGTPPTITVVSNAGGTATFTVLGVGGNPNYYNQGYLIYKTSNAVRLTT